MTTPAKAALLAAVSALVAAPAAGAATVQKLDVKPRSSKAGTHHRPRGTSLKVTTTTATTVPGAQPPATKMATLWFDRHFRFNGRYFPTCRASTLQRRGRSACKSASKVGTGSATGLALGQVEHLRVTAYNADKGKQLLLYVEGSHPLQINSVIIASLKRSGGKYASKLLVPIPESLLHPLTGVDSSLTEFITKVSATHKVHKTVTIHGKHHHRTVTMPYVQTTGCTKHTWHFKGRFDYVDGTRKTATDKVRCH